MCTHVYLIILFEVIFYFQFITYIEKDRILDILNSFSTNIHRYIRDYDIYHQVKNDLIKDICTDFSHHYIYVNNHNLQLVGYDIIYISTIVYIFLNLIHYIVYRNPYFSIKSLLKSMCVMFFICVFEVCFFYNIILKYIVISDNDATCTIIKQLN